MQLLIEQKLLKFFNQTLVLDTESTNIDPNQAEVCELGVFHADENLIKCKLYGTEKPIPFLATTKNNISRHMLADLPKFSDSLDEVIDFLQLNNTKIKYFCAHNYQYDKKLLYNSFVKIGRTDLAEKIATQKWICTYRLSKQIFKDLDIENWSQNYLRYYFNLPCDGLTVHRAGDDSNVCWELLRHISNFIIENLGYLDESFDLGQFFHELTESPIIYEKMPFGKHKDVLFKDIPDSYYEWLLKNHSSLDEKSSDYDSDFAKSIEKELIRRGW